MGPEQILKYTLTLIAMLILFESPFIKNRNIPKVIFYIIPAMVLCILSSMEIAAGESFQDNFQMAVLEAIIVIVAAAVFKIGMDYILQTNKGYKMTNEQMVSIAVIVAIIIYAIPEFGNSYIAPLETAIYFIILFFTYKYGVGQGAITGAVCGFALYLRGAPLADVGMYTMMGIIPAIFREIGRVPTAIIYCITALVLGIINKDMKLTLSDVGALTSAALVFIFLPSSFLYLVDAAGGIGRQEQLATQNLKKIAKARMKIFSESFLKLSKTLDTITEKQSKLQTQEINRIFEDISEKLCKNCDNCSGCWEEHFQRTYQAACTMFETAEKKGVIAREDIPENFLSDCISIDEFITETKPWL